MRALVYGLARSGEAATARLEARGDEVVRVDRSLGNEHQLELLDGVELLVKSPGVPGEVPLVRAARERGIPVWSEIELGFRLLAPGSKLIGVTGTKGKTTTVRLLAAMLEADGRQVVLAGNEHTPLAALGAAEWVVCELSSFQLEDVATVACEVAVLLNIEPDHLNRYASMDDYRAAKLRIFERARVAVVPPGFEHATLGARAVVFSADDPLPAEPPMRGAHNRENAAAATAAARALGVAEAAIAAALSSFPGVPHRLEPAGEVAGVRYVNDSKATNVAAALRALAAYNGEPLHLILGGSPKGESFAPLGAAIGDNVRSIHLVGEAAAELAEALGEAPFDDDRTIGRAVEHAAALARPGEVVLLSPACASYDQYENFERRGEDFKRRVARLAGAAADEPPPKG